MGWVGRVGVLGFSEVLGAGFDRYWGVRGLLCYDTARAFQARDRGDCTRFLKT